MFEEIAAAIGYIVLTLLAIAGGIATIWIFVYIVAGIFAFIGSIFSGASKGDDWWDGYF